MPDPRPAAPVSILYRRDAFDTGGDRLLGRHAAGEGFLRGLLRHGRDRTIGCVARDKKEFRDFVSLVQAWFDGERAFRFVNETIASDLATSGVLYRADPLLLEESFRRQRCPLGSRAYSLCGVTHTISSKAILRGIADLHVAPVEPWDAIVCTSQSVKIAVERLLATWAEHLRERVGALPVARVQLPVIPLGVDSAAFVRNDAARAAIRASLGAGPDDIVALYVGRLVFYAKAHPSPMYLALEHVAKKTGKRIHLVQAGWFEQANEEEDFKATARALAPSVRCHFLDGRKPEVRRNIWSSADFFISLADNIQETFGITPIEAMASGLPVVVSDWDGYRESVRHDIDGIRVPTMTPGPNDGAGADVAMDYLLDAASYSHFVAVAAMSTAASVEAATAAVERLVENPELRATLGANGQKRAREVYDWKHVIHSYDELWQELGDTRLRAISGAPAKALSGPAVPILDDPFRQFGHYATDTLSDKTWVALGRLTKADVSRYLSGFLGHRYGADTRASEAQVLALLAAVKERGSLQVKELRRSTPELDRAVFDRTILYLVKLDLLAAQMRSIPTG